MLMIYPDAKNLLVSRNSIYPTHIVLLPSADSNKAVEPGNDHLDQPASDPFVETPVPAPESRFLLACASFHHYVPALWLPQWQHSHRFGVD